MSIFNKRNALIGWIVLKLGKRKAKQSAPSKATAAKAGAAAGGAAAVGTGLLFWRKRKKSDEPSE
jgi:LPXTG-motif cell wall-anchored protein